MKFLKVIVSAIFSIYSFPVLAQDYQLNIDNVSTGTVPGIYYDPIDRLSPSIKESGFSEQPGKISFDSEDDNLNDYNIQRIWAAETTADKIIKVGDVRQNYLLNELIGLDNITLREIAKNGGVDIDLTSLKEVGLINNMTLGELLSVLPKLKNQSIQNLSLLSKALENLDSRVFELTAIQENVVLDLMQDRAFQNINLSELVLQDWGDFLSPDYQTVLQGILNKYPHLDKVPIDRIFPTIQEQIIGDWQSVLIQIKELDSNTLIKEVFQQFPIIKEIPIGALPIDSVKFKDLPGLADIVINSIPNIEDRYLADLGEFSQTSTTSEIDTYTSLLLLTGDLFGRLDIAYAGETETPITNILSGGTRNQKFKPEPCKEESCKHFEIVDVLSGISGLANIQGKAWVEGKSQSVPGGKGFLRFINNGKERTGVSVWGTNSHVKLSLEDIEEGGNGEAASARIWMNFQICVYPPFLGEHCTPHFIDVPTPWKVSEGGLMVVFAKTTPKDLISQIKNSNDDYRNAKRGIYDTSPPLENPDSSELGIAKGQLINPAPGYRISSGYGRRVSPCRGCSSFHPAVDLATPNNTPIKASDGGTVLAATWWDGYGNTVVIDHGNGIKTRYSHLNRLDVKPGQKVAQGQRIALSGATGYGTGPHLDFGVYQYSGTDWRTPKSQSLDPQTVINFR